MTKPKLDKEATKRFDEEFLNDFGGVHGVTIKQFIAKEKQLSKQEGIEEARKNRNAEPAWATEMENRRLKANPPCWNKNY